MVLKLYQLSDLPMFFEKVKNQKMSFKTSYKLALYANEAQKHINYYEEQFRALILKYCLKDENGNPVPTEDGQGVKLLEETRDEAFQKLQELRDLDVTLSDNKFSPDEFGDVELTPMEMTIILPFIEE
jgi:hypothetical protein